MKYYLFLLLLITSLFAFSQENTIELTDDELNETTEIIPFKITERVPVYKGCDENLDNKSLRECMGEKLNALINKNFNTDVAKNLDIPDQSMVRIEVNFNINPEGKVVDIVAKTNYPELEAEAIRVVSLIPTLKPGFIDNQPVTVPYTLPIKFQVSNIGTSENQKPPIHKGCDEILNYQLLADCATDKVKDYLIVSIDYELADKLFPTDKTTQFKVDFNINKKGKADHITVKAHKKEMAVEVINVLKRMPKFKEPGYKNGKPIDTKMSFLITIHL